MQCAEDHDGGDEDHEADGDEARRKIEVGARRRGSGHRLAAPRPPVGKTAGDAAGDHRQGADEADDATDRHCAGADVENVGAANVVWAHGRDRHRSRRDRSGRRASEEVDRRDEDEVGEDAAGGHGRGDPRADDVADAEQLRRDLRRQGAGRQGRAEDRLGRVLPQLERLHGKLVEDPGPKAGEDRPRSRSGGLNVFGRIGAGAAERPLLIGRPGLEHLGAGRALGIFEDAVLLNDEGPAQRDHHQDSKQSAQQRHQHHPADLQVETEDHDRRHGDADAKGDALAGRTGGLNDVVLEHGGRPQPEASENAEQGDGDDGDGDRGADRQPDFQHQVERRGAEDDPQQHADDERRRGQFAQGNGRRNQGAKGPRRRRWRSGWPRAGQGVVGNRHFSPHAQAASGWILERSLGMAQSQEAATVAARVRKVME